MTGPEARDDLGYPFRLAAPARRVVSLVPSLTESVAVTRPQVLAGATTWCSHAWREPPPGPPGRRPRDVPGRRVALVEGRSLTWYGPSLVTARPTLLAQIAR